MLPIFCHAQDYIDVLTLTLSIEDSIDENKRQKTAKEKQLRNTAYETANKEETKKFKSKYEEIRNRLSKLGLVLDAFIISSEAKPIVDRIIATQKNIYNECVSDPSLIPLAIKSETAFVQQAKLLIEYMTGLMIVIGDVYQMKPADRKMLLNHAVRELRNLDAITSNLYTSIYWHKRAVDFEKLRFKKWINRDKDIINEIITNAKSYG